MHLGSLNDSPGVRVWRPWDRATSGTAPGVQHIPENASECDVLAKYDGRWVQIHGIGERRVDGVTQVHQASRGPRRRLGNRRQGRNRGQGWGSWRHFERDGCNATRMLDPTSMFGLTIGTSRGRAAGEAPS